MKYDAVYYWNNGFGDRFENDPASFARLAAHFFQAFPQLAGIRFTHAWDGAIDTCSRFSPFWGWNITATPPTPWVIAVWGWARVLLDLLDS